MLGKTGKSGIKKYIRGTMRGKCGTMRGKCGTMRKCEGNVRRSVTKCDKLTWQRYL